MKQRSVSQTEGMCLIRVTRLVVKETQSNWVDATIVWLLSVEHQVLIREKNTRNRLGYKGT